MQDTITLKLEFEQLCDFMVSPSFHPELGRLALFHAYCQLGVTSFPSASGESGMGALGSLLA